MAHKNGPVQVTLQEATSGIVSLLAKKEKKTLEFIVEELIAEALELREDYILSKLSDERDVPNAPRVSYEDAWKE